MFNILFYILIILMGLTIASVGCLEVVSYKVISALLILIAIDMIVMLIYGLSTATA